MNQVNTAIKSVFHSNILTTDEKKDMLDILTQRRKAVVTQIVFKKPVNKPLDEWAA